MDIKQVVVKIDDQTRIEVRVPFKRYKIKGIVQVRPTKEAEIVLSGFKGWVIKGGALE